MTEKKTTKLATGTQVELSSLEPGIVFQIRGTVVEPTEEERLQEFGRECEPADPDCSWVKFDLASVMLVGKHAEGPVSDYMVELQGRREPVLFSIEFDDKRATHYNGDVSMDFAWSIPCKWPLDVDQPLLDAMTAWLKSRWPNLEGDPFDEIESIFGEALRRARFEQEKEKAQ